MVGPWCHKDAMHRCPSVGVGKTHEKRGREMAERGNGEGERGRRCRRAKNKIIIYQIRYKVLDTVYL